MAGIVGSEYLVGVWYCANFLGDSFDLTAFDDGALMIQMVRKRFRHRGNAVRLDPCGHCCWEAVHQVRLRLSGNKLWLQEYLDCIQGWSAEVQAFRDSFTATGKYFRDFLGKGKRRKDESDASSNGIIVERESSLLFKVEPFSLERAFKMEVPHQLYHVGEIVERRDKGKEWRSGFVTSVNPLKVTFSEENAQAEGYIWEEVRKKAEDEDIASGSRAVDIECKICMADEADVVLLPCGHSGLCQTCVRKIYLKSGSLSCPFCRQAVANFANVRTGAERIILTDTEVKSTSVLACGPRLAWT